MAVRSITTTTGEPAYTHWGNSPLSAGAILHYLLFGHGNAYYVGHYDSNRFEFYPLGVGPAGDDEDMSTRRLPAGQGQGQGRPIGAWALANASGASTAGPAAVLTAVEAAAGVGSLFSSSSMLNVPYYPALNLPRGFAVSFMLQLNGAPGLVADQSSVDLAGTAVLIGRSDTSWGVEWWVEILLLF